MDRVEVPTLIEIVRQEVAAYNEAEESHMTGYYMEDLARQQYAVVIVPDRPRPFPARVVVMARVVEDWVLIDEDTTNKPLWEALVKAGVSRDQIIKLYSGEVIPNFA